MAKQNSDPSVVLNGVTIYIVPNSLELDEGLGEQKVLTQSAGNGQLQTVYSNDVETNIGGVKFSVRNTDENQVIVRNAKLAGDQNVIEVPSETSDGLNRVYTKMVLTNNYKLPYSSDGVIECDFMGQKPTV